jgi:hypothetical protein
MSFVLLCESLSLSLSRFSSMKFLATLVRNLSSLLFFFLISVGIVCFVASFFTCGRQAVVFPRSDL